MTSTNAPDTGQRPDHDQGWCPTCPGPAEDCPGRLAHHIHDDLRRLPLSRSELAALLHTSPEHASQDNAHVSMDLLRRLPWGELDGLAGLLGISPYTIAAALSRRRIHSRGPDSVVLHVLLIHAGYHGTHPETLAEQLGWTLPRVQNAAAGLADPRPDGPARLVTTTDGRLALRANLHLLPPDAHPVPHGAPRHEQHLDPALAASLRAVLAPGPAPIPPTHQQALQQAGLITTDEHHPQVTSDVAFSLSDQPADHPDSPAASTQTPCSPAPSHPTV